MAHIHFLGTGSSVTDPHRTTTMLALHDPASVIVIDCGGDVVQRLTQSEVPLDRITAVIITHEHPDHTAGFPLMVQKLWLAGRGSPFPVHGIAPALEQARKLFEAFDTADWPGLPPIHWRETPYTAGALMFADDTWLITSTPAAHMVPSVALRIQHRPTGRVCVYSCDTGPSEEIARLAQDAQVLIHEATGSFPGHSSAGDAARIAAAGNVGELYLVHLPPEAYLNASQMEAARRIFPKTIKAEELGRIEL